MIIGSALIMIHIPGASSLKEKRRVLKSLIMRIRNKFNASVAEVSEQDLWQKSGIGVAVVGVDTAHADHQLQQIVRFVEDDLTVEVIGVETYVT